MSLFLTQPEIRELTGFAIRSKQINQLRKMGVAFFVNGCGKPVITTAAIEGRKDVPQAQQSWQPAFLTASRKSA